MIGVLCILIALTILIGSNNMQTVDATSYAEYPAACRAGVTAMEAFCRCMPELGRVQVQQLKVFYLYSKKCTCT